MLNKTYYENIILNKNTFKNKCTTCDKGKSNNRLANVKRTVYYCRCTALIKFGNKIKLIKTE